MAIDAVVLMGPPGCGKSHLGRALRDAGVARYEELEPELLARFGSGEEFDRRKEDALAFLRGRYLQRLGESGLPLAIESTGLSDAPILRELMAAHRIALVAIRTQRDVCGWRVTARERGRNLQNDGEAACRFHDFWHEQVAPGYAFDLELDGLDSAMDVARIAQVLAAAGDERAIEHPPAALE